jgi:hypothetical protein
MNAHTTHVKSVPAHPMLAVTLLSFPYFFNHIIAFKIPVYPHNT